MYKNRVNVWLKNLISIIKVHTCVPAAFEGERIG